MNHTIHMILSIDTTLPLKHLEEDIMISNFLQNLYLSPFLFGDIVIKEDQEVIGVLIEEHAWQRLCVIEAGKYYIKIVEISLGKAFKINSNLTTDQK